MAKLRKCIRLAFATWGVFIVGDNDFFTFGTFTGRQHCLADAVTYAGLSSDDMDIEVTGCLIYGAGENGENAGYDTGSESLGEKFVENE